MTKRPPADQDIRNQALDIGRSMVVRAPAGSGKTTLLTQRFLVLLATVDEPEEIVALTFTRQAAAEMRNRIISALATAASGIAEAGDELQRAQAALARDRAREWGLRDDPARLRIQTIDAFAGGIALAMPLISGLGGRVEIVTDPELSYRAAVRQLLLDLERRTHWSAALEQVLAYLDNDLPRLEDLLVDMLSQRDQWLRLLHADIDASVVQATMARVIEAEIAAVRMVLPTEYAQDLVTLARYAGDNLRLRQPQHTLARLAGITAMPPATVAALGIWQAIAELLLTHQGQWRRQVTVQNGFPRAADVPDADRHKEDFAALVASLSRCEGLDNALTQLRKMPEPEIPIAQWTIMAALLQLLKTAAAYLEVLFAESGQADFTRVALAAERALGDPGQPTDLALALDYRISHLLVDEFQDTSVTQYELLTRVTAGWQAGDGRTVFLVGDPLQSIYRFREANVHLFEQVTRRCRFGDIPVTTLALTANFRSQPALIDWLNTNFPLLNKPINTLRLREIPYAPVVAEIALSGSAGVFVHACRADDADGQLGEVATLIRQLHHEHPDQSIAVLARSRKHITGLANTLRAAGIDARAHDIDTLADSIAVRDLAALTCALVHPADRIAWLSVLRAPWCGLKLTDLAALVAGPEQPAISERIRDERFAMRLSGDGRERLRRVRNAVGSAIPDGDGICRAVERAWIQLGGPACLEDPAEFGPVESFFQCLAEIESTLQPVTRQRLWRELARSQPAAAGAAGNAIVLTTIHKAKGLEYDTVIVPAIEKAVARDTRRLLEWTEILWDESDATLLFAPLPDPTADGATEGGSLYELIRRRERLEQTLELRRLLYVALTRARRAAHLFGAVAGSSAARKPATGSLLEVLWPIVEPEFAHSRSGPESDTRAADGPPALRRLVSWWRLPEPPAGIMASRRERSASARVEFEWAGVMAKFTGSIVHEWLQHIAIDGAELWSPDRVAAIRPRLYRRLRSLGLVEAALENAAGQISAALTAAVTDPRGSWILSSRHTDASAELRLSGVVQGGFVTAVIDRSFVDADGTRWVIDYKTSLHGGGDVDAFIDSELRRYRPQLDLYGALLCSIDARPIRVGLYFPLLQQWREWAYERAASPVPGDQSSAK